MAKEAADIQSLFERLTAVYPVVEYSSPKPGQGFLVIEEKDILRVITELKTVYGFSHLSFLTAVDMMEDGFFYLVYMLKNHSTGIDLGVKAPVSREGASPGSIHHLWKQAATYQRELYEMFGILFEGSPGLTDPFILEGWDEIPPMRREFDTKKYSEETFYPRPGRSSNDTAQYMEDTLYPEHPGKENKR